MHFFVLLLISIISILFSYYSLFENLIILGLFLDVIGAYYIVQSFINKNILDILAESHGTETKDLPGGLSENLAISFYRQSIDAKIGFVILTLGFFIQGLGNLLEDFMIEKYFGAMVVLLVLLISVLIQKNYSDQKSILNKIGNAARQIEGPENKE